MSSTLTTDPYQILGVPKDATPVAIRSAYRKLCLVTHPDKIQDESLRATKQDEFQRLQQAYEILGDETRRQQYDDQVRYAAQKRDLYGQKIRTAGAAAATATATATVADTWRRSETAGSSGAPGTLTSARLATASAQAWIMP